MSDESVVTTSRFSVRKALRRIAAHGILGLCAGGLVFAVEAIDRTRALRHNLNDASEALRLVTLTAAVVIAVGLLSTLTGTIWTLGDAVRSCVTKWLVRVPERWRTIAGILVAAAIVSTGLRILSWFFPLLIEGSVLRLIRRIDTRLHSLGPIGEHPKIVYTVLVAAVTLALMAMHAWLFSARGRRARIAAIGCAIGLFGFALIGYNADSRIEFTRYESMFHMPLEVIYCTATLLGAIAIARAVGDPTEVALSRHVVALGVICALLGVGSVVFGALALDANQNVKALFWNRSVVARRVFQLARYLTDRDGDGYAATFGGGDLVDTDASVHPMAAEIPGNGIDDNCIGGDLAASPFERGALFTSLEAGSSVPSQPPPTAGPGLRDVIVISIDCLRADHLGTYGYSKPTSPNIDRFAAESLVFENTYAQGTNTGHSFTSMYRSSYADDIFDDRIPSWSRLLGEQGYDATLINAVRSDAWLNAARWAKYTELMKDFVYYHREGDKLWDASTLTDESIAYFDVLDVAKRHLTWIHYFDCHRPRKRHLDHDFGRSAAGIFDSNVAYVDVHVGRLIDHLRKTGVLDRSIVFIIADHGEAFLEHGAMDHSNKPYLNNTHVPLIVYAPGAGAGRYREPCGLIDVGPTALGFVGVASPPYYRGIDLLESVRDGALPTRPIVSETPRNLIQSPFFSWALVQWPFKIVYDTRSSTTEVFDIASDPGEQQNLADRDKELTSRMRAILGRWLDEETARTGAVGPGDEGIGGDDED
jgi:choline-sulfatase